MFAKLFSVQVQFEKNKDGERYRKKHGEGEKKSLRKKKEKREREREGERNKESVTRLFSHEMRSDGCRHLQDLSKERLKVSQIELT